jgi:TolA-binding protein
MALKDRVENNLIVVLSAVAVASGGLVAGMMSFANQQSLDNLRSEHRLELSQKGLELNELEGKIAELESQIETQNAQISNLDLIYRFASLHSRALTYASVNPECKPFSPGFGQLLTGAQWDLESLTERYELTVAELTARGIARIHHSRAGSSFLEFTGEATWPVAELHRCSE